MTNEEAIKILTGPFNLDEVTMDFARELDFFLYGSYTPERFPNSMQVRNEHSGLKVNDWKCWVNSPELKIEMVKHFFTLGKLAGAEWMAGQGCNIDSYQKQARTFLLGKFQNMPMFELVKYCTLGLNEEAGEVAGKIKKSIRDADGEIDEGRIDAIVKEMGDVLWYLAIMAYSLGLPLSHIAQKNIEKLSDRMNRGKIQGEGDER